MRKLAVFVGVALAGSASLSATAVAKPKRKPVKVKTIKVTTSTTAALVPYIGNGFSGVSGIVSASRPACVAGRSVVASSTSFGGISTGTVAGGSWNIPFVMPIYASVSAKVQVLPRTIKQGHNKIVCEGFTTTI